MQAAAFIFAFSISIVVVEAVPEAAGSPKWVESAIFVGDSGYGGVLVRVTRIAGVAGAGVGEAGAQGGEQVVGVAACSLDEGESTLGM